MKQKSRTFKVDKLDIDSHNIIRFGSSGPTFDFSKDPAISMSVKFDNDTDNPLLLNPQRMVAKEILKTVFDCRIKEGAKLATVTVTPNGTLQDITVITGIATAEMPPTRSI